jgi:2-polyprenyl-3-methyl-5-hydroxy-6-metoxy-1,4-benzoquinol methylase
MKKCRICGSLHTIEVDRVNFYKDFSDTVYDCLQCKSRFTDCHPDLYEQFHSSKQHYYSSRMEAWTREARILCEKQDEEALKKAVQRFHFAMPRIIETFEQEGVQSVLEVGCAWGYNLSWFIMQNKQCLGIDISSTAIEKAREAFGDHFDTVESAGASSPARLFDGIYHLGTIGCVESPIEFTSRLLAKLKPGGVLMFNAPSRRQCEELSSPWIWGACPPDLVTLFDDSFWAAYFKDRANVKVDHSWLSPAQTLRLRFARRRQVQPNRGSIYQTSAVDSDRWLRLLARPVKALIKLYPPALVNRVSNPFGTIVRLTKPALD